MTIRWGILGASRIAARAFIPNARLDERNVIVAIASKNLPKAKAFAAEHEIENSYDNYQALFEDPNIDAIYIAQPPIYHPELTLQAVNSNKAVLVEKPFSITKQGVSDFLAAAPANHLAWEALVFAFHPQMKIANDLTKDLGPIKHIYGHFVYIPEKSDDYRADPNLGGGALHDVGTYPLRAAQLIMQDTPKLVEAQAVFNALGANDEGNAFFEYPSGATFHMHWSCRKTRDKSLVIEYESGAVVFEEPFHPAASDYVLVRQDGKTRQISSGGEITAWQYAITHIVEVLSDMVEPIHQIRDFSLVQADLLEQIDRHTRK
jgi:predicted dehydrogenase